MDTRRRSDSRESGRPPSAPDEPVAEIVELSPVPQPRRRGVMPVALGLAVFAGGVLAGSSIVRLVPADVAVASTSPDATTTALGTPTPSRTPSGSGRTPAPTGAPRVTPRPTPVPTIAPWVWRRGTAIAGASGAPVGLWSAGGDFVVSVSNEDRTMFQVSHDAVTWATNDSSRAIVDYMASTVIGDHPWFALRIVGLQEDHIEIGYPEWAEDGANVRWVTNGPIDRDTPDWVTAIAKVGSTWVMSPGRYFGEGGSQEVWVSDDGQHWSTVHPSGAESVAIYHLARLRSKLVAFGQLQTAESDPVALTTTDGRHWTSRAFPGPVGGGTTVYALACGEAACVAVGSTSTNGTERPAIWSTTDGLTWQVVGKDSTDVRQDGYLSVIKATPAGFVALGAPEQEVLLSRDGVSWASVPVLARGDSGTIRQLAIGGDVVFALGDDITGGAVQWTGNLAALPFP